MPADTNLSELIINGFIDVKQDIGDLRERIAVVETKIAAVEKKIDDRGQKSARSAKGWGMGAAGVVVGAVELLHKIGWLK